MTDQIKSKPGPRPDGHHSIRPALRRAIDEIAISGLSIREAATRAGMSESALSLALRKPHVRDALQAVQADALTDLSKLTAQARVAAIRQGIELMNSAKSEVIRAKMVELFNPREPSATPRKAASAPIFEPASPSNGYTYTKPGTPQDRPSGAQDGQAIDKTKPEPDG